MIDQPTFHRLDIRRGGDGRIRVIAFRRSISADELYADFDIAIITQKLGDPPRITEGTLDRFARGLGVDLLFAQILTHLAEGAGPAIDEDGKAFPVPEPTGDEYLNGAEQHLRAAIHFWQRAKAAGRKSRELHELLQIFARHEEIDAAKPTPPADTSSVLPSMRTWAEKNP